MFGSVSEENVARIKRQNSRKISVIIGNPPYNANQQNENDNNKNRIYPRIDERIKDTYIKQSTAQKTKAYDMYTRFFRWASDRLHDDGILAFITNRSFIDSRTMDGFRRTVAAEYSDIYVVDLGGDVRANPKLSGTKNNVFGIQTGVAISFLVKRRLKKGEAHTCVVHYVRRPEMDTAEDKIHWLGQMQLSRFPMESVRPDAKANWINSTINDFDEFIPIAGKTKNTIFSLGANAIKTNRDDWVFDFNLLELKRRSAFLVERFNSQLKRGLNDAAKLDYAIKWSSGLKSVRSKIVFSEEDFVEAVWRPFVRKFYFSNKSLSDRLTDLHFRMFGSHLGETNRSILVVFGSRLPFTTFAVDRPVSYSLLSLDPVYSLPESQFSKIGEREANVTDWAVNQFRSYYKSDKQSKRPITKDAIFHYVYGVLHDPIYRKTYAQNLKREFPRIPFYEDFWQWADWGEALMALHIGYEAVKPWKLKRIDVPDEKSRKAKLAPKPSLKADKDNGVIVLDSETQLSGVPPQAWTYRLGNRSALEWILDQYKEKAPKDPTIRAKFNTYRFADHKEKVIDLLSRVTRVSVETMAIVEAMRALKR